MKKTIVMILVLFFVNAKCYSQIVNEIMYSPAEASNEWFEIFNTSSFAVDLQNWKWKDATSSLRTITTQNTVIDTNSYLVICQDSVKFRNQFTAFNGKFIQTAWSQLNNSGDNLILINPAGIRVDSITFSSSWGGNTGGYSLEKINSSGPQNLSSNWGTSIDPDKATPCKKNSITPKPFDLLLKSFRTEPLFPSTDETLTLISVIKNPGVNTAQNFQLKLYRDSNLDSVTQPAELINSQSTSLLNSGDSIIHVYTIQDPDTGTVQFISKIIYADDYDTLNNQVIKRLYVSSQSGSGGMVINEIMYDPLTNQSEWIEFYNASAQAINIKKWKFKDASVTVTLSDSDVFLNPGDYLILAHDSSVYQKFAYIASTQNLKVKIFASVSLNNSGEDLSLTDSMNNVADRVAYFPGWHNSELIETKGISLERINPAFTSGEKSNWSSCANTLGGTPGLQNSIFTKSINTNAEIGITPNPFSPDGDGLEDFALIRYKLTSPFSQMNIKIYDIKGRLVRNLANNNITGSEGTIVFNGLGNDNQKLRIGIYILLIEAIDARGGRVNNVKAAMVIGGKM
ncbi:MAG: lamin tail domain-containing protein [bacterium]|nr:lamin tail domain-containing protein [bacterium]